MTAAAPCLPQGGGRSPGKRAGEAEGHAANRAGLRKERIRCQA